MATTITRKSRSARGAEGLGTDMPLLHFTSGRTYPQLASQVLAVRYLAQALEA